VKYYLGQPEEAQRLAARAAEWLDRTADRYFQIQNFLALGRFAMTHGDLDAAAGWVRQALPPSRVLGGWLLVEASRYLVEVLVLQGLLEEARDVVAGATEAVPEEDGFARGESLLSTALVEAAEGGEGAAARMQKALALLEEQNVPIELAEARISCARVLTLRGQEAEARRLLEAVRASAEGTEARMLLTVVDEMTAGLAV
jgi:MalT-like TPR region